MITPPKAKKFRIKRSPSEGEGSATAEAAPAPKPAATAPRAPATAASAAQNPSAMSEAQMRVLAARQAALQGNAPQNQAPQQAPQAAMAPRPVAAPAGNPAAAQNPQVAQQIAQQRAAMAGQVASAGQVSMEQALEAIRQEGLTGRQLRLARRVAQKHNVPATSDFEAVYQLRARGIDPFEMAGSMELAVPNQTAPASQEIGRIQLPQTVDQKQQMPSTDVNPAERREQEISRMQREIARRRRRKSMLLATRLAFFVVLPTLLTAFYFNFIATPMYSTTAKFLILKADGGSSSAGMGSMLSATPFASTQDSIAVQEYLLSKDAMLRLDGDLGFRAHFSDPSIDFLQRLPADATIEKTYKVYTRNISIGYDPTEGVIAMEISAASPELAAEFATHLIGYAEERVDNLSKRKRNDQVSEAENALEEARLERLAAQEKLVRLQQEGDILDPEGKIAALRSQISNVEVQLQEKQLQLQAQLENSRPNQAKVESLQGDVRRLGNLLNDLNAQMTDASQGENSLANLTLQIQLAQADLQTRDMMLQSALEHLTNTRREANSQARYLTTSVEPIVPQDPSYPRKFENSALAFLVFAGIYLMMSLTASILREQVSS